MNMAKIGTKNGSVKAVGTVNGKPASAHDAGKVSRIGNQYIKTGGEPKLKAFSSGVPLGNEAAKNVGAGGPGTGRTVYGPGSQGKH
jgi:hypothetical protein